MKVLLNNSYKNISFKSQSDSVNIFKPVEVEINESIDYIEKCKSSSQAFKTILKKTHNHPDQNEILYGIVNKLNKMYGETGSEIIRNTKNIFLNKVFARNPSIDNYAKYQVYIETQEQRSKLLKQAFHKNHNMQNIDSLQSNDLVIALSIDLDLREMYEENLYLQKAYLYKKVDNVQDIVSKVEHENKSLTESNEFYDLAADISYLIQVSEVNIERGENYTATKEYELYLIGYIFSLAMIEMKTSKEYNIEQIKQLNKVTALLKVDPNKATDIELVKEAIRIIRENYSGYTFEKFDEMLQNIPPNISKRKGFTAFA